MTLSIKIISGDNLIKRWRIKPAELLFMLMNHPLHTAQKLGWDTPIEKAPTGEALSLIVEDHFSPVDFMYWIEDVLELESKYPQLKSNDRGIISTEELGNRWCIQKEELLEAIQSVKLVPIDPVGLQLDWNELFALINHHHCVSPYDLIYRVSDIEAVEQQNPELKQNSETITTTSQINDLMKSTKPEIERLYKTIKTDNFLGYDTSKMKNAALHEFESNHQIFSYIESAFLKDISIYPATPGQEARDFKGKLLQSLIKKHGFRKQSYQNLYKNYLKLS